MLVHYLEVVTPEVDATCLLLGDTHGVTFAPPEENFGHARIADMKNGGRIGVRAPMSPEETPVVRPYALVEDIGQAVQAAESQGAVLAMAPTEIPGSGQFAIYFLGGIQHGLWQQG